jgi:hypothetical protein
MAVSAPRGLRLELKVVPGATRNEIAGWLGRRLKVRIAAAAEKGRANAELTAFLAARLGLPKAAVRLVGGAASRLKRVEITGLSEEELLSRLPKRC